MPNVYYLIDSLENKYQLAKKVCDWDEAHRLFIELEGVRQYVPVEASATAGK